MILTIIKMAICFPKLVLIMKKIPILSHMYGYSKVGPKWIKRSVLYKCTIVLELATLWF
jgi:hypothetical protein